MFRLSGVRETFNVLNEEMAMKLGNIFGQHMKETIVIAKDLRKTSDVLANAVKTGALASGKNIVDLRATPTPIAEFYAQDKSSLFVITASHNPAEYNGIKIKINDIFITPDKAKAIYNNTGYKRVEWKKVGNERFANPLPLYFSKIKTLFNKVEIPVILDFGGGVVSTAKEYLKKMMPKADFLFDKPDPLFSSRPSEPIEKNLQALKKKVMENNIIGIAFDGDGDRATFFDEQGNFWSGDDAFALITYFYLKYSKDPRKENIVSTIATSKKVDLVAKQFGANVVHTKVGVSYISKTLKELKQGIAGESSSGIIYPKLSIAKDGIASALLLLNYLEKEDLSLNKCWQFIPKLYTKQISIKTEKAKALTEKAKAFIKTLDGKINEKEGIRIDEKDGWLLIRPSNTEPKIRIFAEYKSKAKAEKRVDEIREYLGI